ncbi:CidA/LrgA family protein [Utexia brackfieldae]|uniref:CidA/LrgA family protein n=1 Tax=Utexia brackfieldae TaxID=3074108 RepID=UPI00370DD59E
MKPFLSQPIPWATYCRALFCYARALLIIILCLWAGSFVSTLLPIMIPGSILGLLILFFLLSFQLIPSHWIKEGCNLFMRYMTVLFIPAGMGIMDTYTLLFDNFLPIVIGCLASTIIVLLLIGYLTQYLHRRNSNKVIK